MAMNMNEIEVSKNQDFYHLAPSCRNPDIVGVYINPDDSISADAELPRLQIDSNSETPDKYPNAPQTSPIDIQNNPDSSVFNAELLKCLSKLPVIFISSEECSKEASSEVYLEDPIRNLLEASCDSEVKSDIYKGVQDQCENIVGTKILSKNTSSNNNESADLFSIVTDNHIINLDSLRVDSKDDFNSGIYRRSTLSDKESLIVNWGSDVSADTSPEDEYESSDDNSSNTSRDRIEFEALAIDSVVDSTFLQRIQQWKIRGRSKRALSLDEIVPSKISNATDFSKSWFELNI